MKNDVFLYYYSKCVSQTYSMKNRSKFIPLGIVLMALLMTSCVSKKKYAELETQNQEAMKMVEEVELRLADCNSKTKDLEDRIRMAEQEIISKDAMIGTRDERIGLLEDQIEVLKNTNANLLDRMADLSIVSQAGAESIKKSLESINQQSKYINTLTNRMQQRDSLMLNLVMNLKRSLSDVNDEDVSVNVRGGVVLISISDKMLYASGSYEIQPRAKEVLGKVANVLNDHASLDIIVEGHTDSVPINRECMQDNWDLSAKRAISVVRVLQNDYDVDPARMTAGGRSEYVPKESNETAAGRQLNRRTEIVITPKLDQYFQLLQPNAEK